MKMRSMPYCQNIHKSIRFKMFGVMLLVMLVPILLVTFFSVRTTYNAMYAQLIENKRKGIDWLTERLTIQLSEYSDLFYRFEVNKTIKQDIQNWCAVDGTLDYAARSRIISEFNTLISVDSAINSIDLYNLVNEEMLTVTRAGARVQETGERLAFWQERPHELQSNLVLLSKDNELLLSHRMNRFENGMPLALVVCHIRPLVIENILHNMRSSQDESVFLFNDDMALISQSLGSNAHIAVAQALQLWPWHESELATGDGFWFFRNVGHGKLYIVQAVKRSVINTVVGKNVFVGLMAATVAVLAAIGLSLLFSKTFSKPIILLAAKMQTLSIRDYNTGGASRRNDEIGLLENSFDEMMARNQELISQKFQTRIEKRSAQLRALQAQINPHFMYNTLQIIGGMALKKNAPEIYTIIVALSDIMRYSLSFGKEMVQLSEELRYLDSYLSIQHQRFGERLQITRMIDSKLLNCLIPKLILQPIVENSLEHGLSDKAGTWEITMCGTMQNDDMCLCVTDNGLGMEEERLCFIRSELNKGVENAIGSSVHIGLVNVNSRIRLKYAGHYGVTIESHKDVGTTVKLLMPAQWEE